MVIPCLKQDHLIRVFDLVPPKDKSVEFVKGSVNDIEAIRTALDGVEGVVYMVLGRKADGSRAVDEIDANYDLSVKGLHRVLDAMKEAGLMRAVYASTLSVHHTRPGGACPNEDIPADSPSIYGFTKWLGELVCAYFARVHKMTLIALRLNGPVTREQWHKQCRAGHPNAHVAAPDIARAIIQALTAPVSGFHALFIAGDYEGKAINCARAREVLGWEPLERPGADR
jgi:nucleoside-diphosphate-sugar epimerase